MSSKYKDNVVPVDESFLDFESKVNQLMKVLEDMGNINKTDAEGGSKRDKEIPDVVIDPEKFIVTTRDNRTVLNKKAKDEDKDKDKPAELDKYTFMQQIEKDADERARVRKEREYLAQHFRSLGNEAFRKDGFEKAIIMYTKAIEHVKDSPILYNNRALAFIKVKNYKRAVMDCETVVSKLEEKNLRAWLYRAAAYMRLADELNFENSIRFARKHNPKKAKYIDKFVEKIKIGAL